MNIENFIRVEEIGITIRQQHLRWSEKCCEIIRIPEAMKDILSPGHSRFVKIY